MGKTVWDATAFALRISIISRILFSKLSVNQFTPIVNRVILFPIICNGSEDHPWLDAQTLDDIHSFGSDVFDELPLQINNILCAGGGDKAVGKEEDQVVVHKGVREEMA